MARGGGARRVPRAGRYGKARESWLTVNTLELVRYEHLPHDDEVETDDAHFEYDDLPDHLLSFSNPHTSKRVTVSLTSLRADELDALAEFLQRAIDLARPTVLELDRRAEQELEEGNDDSHVRNYRPVPCITIRPRT